MTALLALSLFFAPAPGKIPASWRACKLNADCDIYYAACSAAGVNRRYLKAAMEGQVNCLVALDTQRKEVAVCRARRCEVVIEGPGALHGLGRKFTRAEDYAKAFDDPARDTWQKPAEVMARLEVEGGMTVADIGAGTGYFEPYLSRAVGPGGKVLALDVEADMVRYLGERAEKEKLTNVTAKKVEYDDPGLDPESVDRILIVDTWHHIDNRERYATKLAAALVKKGLLVIVDYTLASRSGPPKAERVPPEQVVSELVAAGLDAEIASETLPNQYIVIGKLRKVPSR